MAQGEKQDSENDGCPQGYDAYVGHRQFVAATT